ncbi:hypothetical protein NC651_019909 [Populus alba x Populus x berolinensis]|nr:hypothetical protein NC651_019909 [Populus alba x Populus x berolinensis]
MSTFADSFAQSESTRPFDDDDSYAGYNSQPFDESFATGDNVFESQPPIYGQFSPQENGEFGGSEEGRISLSPSETEAEQGLALIEWRRQNVILLEDKERREKEVSSQIIKESEDYKVEFYKKRQFTCENNKTTNREKEKHDTPPHLKHSPAAASSTANAAKTCDATGVTASIKANTVVNAPEPVAVA